MKVNKTIGLLALAMAALILTQCKKEENNILSVSRLTAKESVTKEGIAAAKTWLAQQQAALAKSGGAIQLADAEKINWHSPISGTDVHTLFVPVATDNKQMAKYLKITTDANGAIASGNYVYLYSTMNKQADAYLLEGKKIPTEFSGTILAYGLNNQLLGSKVYEKGHAMADKTAKLVFKPTSGKGNTAIGGNTQAKVVCYQYYIQTFVNGQLVSESYLYTMCYGTPDVTLEDGVGGGMDDEAALMAEFNDHIKSTSTPANVTVPETTPQPDPISFTHDWVVVEGAIANWKVMATTRMDYYNKKYYDIQLNAIEHNYDIVYLKTANVQYVGSNTFITTTWTTTSILDNIYSNNTSNAYGKSHVFGKLKHRANFSVPNPFNPSSPISPDAETAPNNYCITLAR